MKKKPVSEVKKTRSAPVPEKKSDMLALNEEEAGIGLSIDRDIVENIAAVIVAIAATFVIGTGSGALVAAISVLAVFVPDLFPDDTFTPISAKILELIDSEIEKAQRNTAIATANARVRQNVETIDEVLNDFAIWEKTSNKDEEEKKKIRLQHHYIKLTRDYGAKLIGDFTREDFGGALVSQYVSSASLYLPVLRAYYQYANDLDLAVRRDNVDLQASVLTRLRKDIADFTNKAVELYNCGKKKIIERGTKKQRTWDDFNDYRNMMALTALDLLPTFSYLDPLLYPTGCHSRYLNRKLVTEFNTYRIRPDKPKRYDILRYDSYYYFVRGVTSLKSIKLFYGYFEAGSVFQMHDGLYASQCTILSADGFKNERTLAVTGNKNPGPGSRKEKVLNIGTACFAVTGRHPVAPGIPPVPFSRYRSVSAIVSMKFIFDVGNDESSDPEVKFFYYIIPESDLFSFKQSIPSIGNAPLLPSKFSERLVDFDSIYDRSDKKFTHVLSWRHKTVLQDLLPERNHVVDAALNPVEPFHAVRAAASIWDENRKLIEGPGFTGGDLVTVGPGENLRFHLTRNPARWFAGMYQVRLWYVNVAFPGEVADVSIRCIPDGDMLESELTAEIPALMVRPDLAQLKYQNLVPHLFSGSILIVAGMPGFELRFGNQSLTASILVDRIELVFGRFATYDEILA